MMHLANTDENYKILNVESQVQILLQFTSSEKIIYIESFFYQKIKNFNNTCQLVLPQMLKIPQIL